MVGEKRDGRVAATLACNRGDLASIPSSFLCDFVQISGCLSFPIYKLEMIMLPIPFWVALVYLDWKPFEAGTVCHLTWTFSHILEWCQPRGSYISLIISML